MEKKLLKTKTVRVSHNADGTKSGVALSASWRFFRHLFRCVYWNYYSFHHRNPEQH